MKKRNEDDLNDQEKHSEELSAEDLKELNYLFERLHQADYKLLGSIEINIYKPGSQHVDYVDNQNFYGDKWAERPKADKSNLPALPEALSTKKAMALWEKVQKVGYVNANYQPQISRTQAALLADAMAERLGIREKWKVFEALWNRKYMYKDYYRSMEQHQSLLFQDKLKQLLS